MARKPTVRKGKKGKAGAGKARKIYRAPKNVPEWASCSETFSNINPLPGPAPLTNAMFPANNMYVKRDFSLEQFARATQIAKGYQHYRITKITMKFKPLVDTFTNSAALASVPNLFYMIDKSGSLPNNPTLPMLKQMGAKAHRFDDRPIVVSWRPSVLDLAATAPANASSAQYKISPWLSTNANQLGVGVWNPSTVDHLGIFWYSEQDISVQLAYYSIETTVEFQFKKPLAQLGTGEEHTAPAIQV